MKAIEFQIPTVVVAIAACAVVAPLSADNRSTALYSSPLPGQPALYLMRITIIQ